MCLARFAETSVYACLSMPTATGGLILRGWRTSATRTG